MDSPRQSTPTDRERTDGSDDWRRFQREAYRESPPPRRSSGLDFAAVFILLDAIRRVVPRELEEQFTRLIREALLALRSLIDWYLERLDRPRQEPRVEDIRID